MSKPKRPKVVVVGPYRCSAVRPHKTNGLWYWRARDGAKTKWTGWARREDVHGLVAEAMLSGALEVPKPVASHSCETIADLLQLWGGYIEDDRPLLGQRTKNRYRADAESLIAAIGSVRCSRIDGKTVLQYTKRTLATGASEHSVVNRLKLLGFAWSWGRSVGLIQDRDLPIKLWKPQNKRPKYTPPVSHLPLVLAQTTGWHYQVVLQIWRTGARIREMADLGGPDGSAWDRVDLQQGCFRILGKGERGGKERIVPIVDPALFDLLKGRRDAGKPLYDVRASTILGVTTTKLKAACDAAGVPRFTCHALRRLFVDSLARQGVDIGTACKLTGHSPLVMLEHYRGVNESDMRQALQATLVSAQVPAGKVVSGPWHSTSGTRGENDG